MRAPGASGTPQAVRARPRALTASEPPAPSSPPPKDAARAASASHAAAARRARRAAEPLPALHLERGELRSARTGGRAPGSSCRRWRPPRRSRRRSSPPPWCSAVDAAGHRAVAAGPVQLPAEQKSVARAAQLAQGLRRLLREDAHRGGAALHRRRAVGVAAAQLGAVGRCGCCASETQRRSLQSVAREQVSPTGHAVHVRRRAGAARADAVGAAVPAGSRDRASRSVQAAMHSAVGGAGAVLVHRRAARERRCRRRRRSASPRPSSGESTRRPRRRGRPSPPPRRPGSPQDTTPTTTSPVPPSGTMKAGPPESPLQVCLPVAPDSISNAPPAAGCRSPRASRRCRSGCARW